MSPEALTPHPLYGSCSCRSGGQHRLIIEAEEAAERAARQVAADTSGLRLRDAVLAGHRGARTYIAGKVTLDADIYDELLEAALAATATERVDVERPFRTRWPDTASAITNDDGSVTTTCVWTEPAGSSDALLVARLSPATATPETDE
jgi:hypothetical protein